MPTWLIITLIYVGGMFLNVWLASLLPHKFREAIMLEEDDGGLGYGLMLVNWPIMWIAIPMVLVMYGCVVSIVKFKEAVEK